MPFYFNSTVVQLTKTWLFAGTGSGLKQYCGLLCMCLLTEEFIFVSQEERAVIFLRL